MTDHTRRELMDRYAAGYDEVARALEGASDAELDARPAPGKWTALTASEWQRAGTHTESGPYSVERWLEIYADHAHAHADQIRRARASAR